MAKGQNRGNREAKKPKADKKPAATSTAVPRYQQNAPTAVKFPGAKGSAA